MRKRLSLIPLLGLAFLVVLLLFIPLLRHSGLPSANQKQAVSYDKKTFIKMVAPLAQETTKYYGICPSLIIAQASLSSNYGQTLLASKYHNLFGVKAEAGDQSVTLNNQVYIMGKWQSRAQKFKRYSSWEKSVYDYLDQLKNGQTLDKEMYTILVSKEGYKRTAQRLQELAFEKDSQYANKLVKIIEENNLTGYDE